MGGGALPNSQLSVVDAQDLNFGTFQGKNICKSDGRQYSGDSSTRSHSQ